jgi:integrase
MGFKQDNMHGVYRKWPGHANIVSADDPGPVPDIPIQSVKIDWDRQIQRRPRVLATGEMNGYLLKPEVLELLESEEDLQHRMVLDIMWLTGARISEVLALSRASFVQEPGHSGVWLQPIRSGPGRPSKASLARSPRRFVPIHDRFILKQIHDWGWFRKCRVHDRLFPLTRQAVSHRLSERVWIQGGPPIPITCSTLRRSFAVHLLLHGRPLSYVAELLGIKDVSGIEAYERVLRLEDDDLIQGINFHD